MNGPLPEAQHPGRKKDIKIDSLEHNGHVLLKEEEQTVKGAFKDSTANLVWGDHDRKPQSRGNI